MSNNSAPDFGKAPTFDEVVKYAIDNDLFGKVSLVKFCEYYGDFRGKGGIVIDWKSNIVRASCINGKYCLYRIYIKAKK